MVVYKYTHMCINNTHTLVYCNSFWITSNSYNNVYVLYSCYKLLFKEESQERSQYVFNTNAVILKYFWSTFGQIHGGRAHGNGGQMNTWQGERKMERNWFTSQCIVGKLKSVKQTGSWEGKGFSVVVLIELLPPKKPSLPWSVTADWVMVTSFI